MRGVPKRMEHENRPVFSTEFEQIVHMLAYIGNRNTGGHRNLLVWQISNGYFDIIGTELGNHYPLEPPF